MCAFEITCALRQGGCVMWSAARLFTHGFHFSPVSVQGGGLSATCYDANEVNTSSSARLHLMELWFPCLHVSQFVRLSKIAAICLLNGNVFWRPGNKIPSRYSSHFLLWPVAIGVDAAMSSFTTSINLLYALAVVLLPARSSFSILLLSILGFEVHPTIMFMFFNS